MMTIGGQIPAFHEPSREPMLILGFADSADAICVDAGGAIRLITANELITAWYWDSELGVWNTAQASYEEVLARAAEDDQPEDLPSDLPDADGAGDGDPTGRGDRGEVEPSEEG